MDSCTSTVCASESELLARDQQVLWHPYRQPWLDGTPLPIVRGEGAYLFTAKGERYIDAYSSWWVNLHGHAHPYIIEKIHDQAQQLEQVGFADATHPLAVTLAENLLQIAPVGLKRVFYSDNGSTAVEIALKIAIQFWHNRGERERRGIVAFKGGFHGETFGAMSLAGRSPLHRPFWPFFFDVHLIDPPYPGKELASYEQLQAVITNEKIACFLFEPLVQGVSGMITHTAVGLDQLLALCQEEGVLTIADEVMTGFGRLNTRFACDQLLHSPSLLCCAKGLTGGFLPLGATLCTEEIYRAFLSSERQRALLHGHSYTANPLACAAALASLDLLETAECCAQRAMITEAHQRFVIEYGSHRALRRCESLGTLLMLEYTDEVGSYFSPLRDRLMHFLLSRGVLTRPLGTVVYLMPPYCVTAADLTELYHHLIDSLENLP